MTKSCRACKVEKSLEEFRQVKGKPDAKCRACYNAYMKAWYAKDPDRQEHIKTQRREAQQKILSNPEQKAKLYRRMADWREENNETVREQGRIRQKKYRADPSLHERELVRKCGYAIKDREKNLAYAKKRQAERQQFLNDIKNAPCKDCGQSFPPYVMDFDHVSGDKVGNLSEMKSYSMESILEEIGKCDLVCSNCHRIRTHDRNKSTGS